MMTSIQKLIYVLEYELSELEHWDQRDYYMGCAEYRVSTNQAARPNLQH